LGKGLTCATYIVAILKSLGFPLLLEDSWPIDRADDQLWQRAIIEELRKSGAEEDYIAVAQNDVGAKRYRPAEVVGSATNAAWPVVFSDATALAAAVLADVQAALSG
ncbi:hypothetical protein, partial [Bradyrhizobium sp.]|uniref:hypothetical protein n=1 Tax=Bradyrhizobium sp. TaxID=376 RepID=UPI003C21262D